MRFFTNLLVLRIYVENELFALLWMVRYCESALIQAPTTRLEGSVSLKLLTALNFVNIFHDGDLDLFFSIDGIEISQTYHLLMIINNKQIKFVSIYGAQTFIFHPVKIFFRENLVFAV